MYSYNLRNKLVDFLLRGGTLTPPSTLYVALLTSKPSSTDVYTELGNITPNGYARVALSSTNTVWAAADTVTSTATTSTGLATGATTNLSAIALPTPTGNWFHGNGPDASLITHIGLFDASSVGTGNLWLYAPLVGQKKVFAGEINIQIPAHGLSFTLAK